MEVYSTTKKKEILSFTGKWMELENIILSEVSQAQRPKATCSPSYVNGRSKTNAAYSKWEAVQGKETKTLNEVDVHTVQE
jgi:hypothetical protein